MAELATPFSAAAAAALQQPKASSYIGPACGLWVFRRLDKMTWQVGLAQTPGGALGAWKGSQEVIDKRSRKATAVREVREESSLEPSEYHVLLDHEFVQINDKGNVSVVCFAALYTGEILDRQVQPQKNDELGPGGSLWMNVTDALKHPLLMESRRELIRQAWNLIMAACPAGFESYSPLGPFSVFANSALVLGAKWLLQPDLRENAIVHKAGGPNPHTIGGSVGAAASAASAASTTQPTPLFQALKGKKDSAASAMSTSSANSSSSSSVAPPAFGSDEFPSLGSTTTSFAPLSKKQQRQQAFANKSVASSSAASIKESGPRAASSSQSSNNILDAKAQSALSHLLSKVLRHTAASLGLALDSAGYAKVTALLALPALQRLRPQPDLQQLQYVASMCAKQRFGLKQDPDTHEWLIRANQGHNVSLAQHLDASVLMQPLLLGSATPLPTICVHGTTMAGWSAIASSGGLHPMDRSHIHFSAHEFGAAETVSGMRNSSQVLIYVDIEQCLRWATTPDARKYNWQLEFFQSANDVLLTSGVQNGLNGVLPSFLFERVEEVMHDRSGGKIAATKARRAVVGWKRPTEDEWMEAFCNGKLAGPVESALRHATHARTAAAAAAASSS